MFTTFPPEDSLGLFVCYEGHIQDVKTAEIVVVAICSRSYHKMPVLIRPARTEQFLVKTNNTCSWKILDLAGFGVYCYGDSWFTAS